MKKERKKKVIYFILFIILIIIILLLRSCMSIDHVNDLVPTGNIDIFDINIDKNCCDNCNCKCNDNSGNKKKETSDDNTSRQDEPIVPVNPVTPEEPSKPDEPVNPVEPTEPEEEEDEPVIVYEEAGIYDKSGQYLERTNLNIFSNPAYEYKNIIAPTSSNVYQFVVRNDNGFPIKYRLIMTEDNEYHVNMKYRLKMNGSYVVGDNSTWVTYEDLHLEGLSLTASSKDVYQLEWKWFESANDTEVGKIADVYALKISFDGEEALI